MSLITFNKDHEKYDKVKRAFVTAYQYAEKVEQEEFEGTEDEFVEFVVHSEILAVALDKLIQEEARKARNKAISEF